MPTGSDTRRHLLDVLMPVVANLDFDLEDVTVSVVGRRSVVRVIVDGDDGVDLDAVADVSRAVSEVLDSDGTDGFAGSYVLEVSSPGVDRPLAEQRHWRRAIGRLVKVTVGGTTLTDRITATDADGVQFESTAKTIPWDELGAGQVQVEFNRRGETDQAEVGDE